jgi:hypothetical protein
MGSTGCHQVASPLPIIVHLGWWYNLGVYFGRTASMAHCLLEGRDHHRAPASSHLLYHRGAQAAVTRLLELKSP